MWPSNEYPTVFIVHRGPDCKDKADELRDELRAEGVHAFVDERDLAPGSDAPKEMKAALHNAKAAVVLLTKQFFDSPDCLQELEYVVELRKNSLAYFPIFLGQSVYDVYKQARLMRGKGFAEQVVGRTGVRHHGELCNSPDWNVTKKLICNNVLSVPNIKIRVVKSAVNHNLSVKLPSAEQQEAFECLQRATAEAAANRVLFQDSGAHTATDHVWIFCHDDMQHIAAQLDVCLKRQGFSTFRAVQPKEPTKASQQEQGTELLLAKVAVVVYCGCFFRPNACTQHLMRLRAGHCPCIAVYYKADDNEMLERAVDLAGEEFAQQVFHTNRNIVVKHHGIVIGSIYKTERQTIREVCRQVENFCRQDRQHEQEFHKEFQRSAAASAATSAALTSQPMVPMAEPWNMWAQQTQMQQQGAWVPQQAVPYRNWQQGAAAQALQGTLLQPVQPVYKAPMSLSATPNNMQEQVACLATGEGSMQFAAGRGCIMAVSELPAGSIAGPQWLYSSVRSWAKAAADAVRMGAAESRTFAASAGGGMVAWCQQGWGVFLPPGAPDAPELRCPAPIIAASSQSIWLPLQLAFGSSSTASPDGSSVSQTCSAAAGMRVIIKDGFLLHNLELVPGPEAGITLQQQVVCREAHLLLTASADGSFYHSQCLPLLVLEADISVISELNQIVAAHEDIPVVNGLYHVLLQPSSQLSVCTTTAMGASDSPDAASASAAEAAIAASRATAAYYLLVLAIEQGAVRAAEWLLGRLAALHESTPAGGTSTMSALLLQQQQQQQQQQLVLLAAGSDKLQQVFTKWSEQHKLPVDVLAAADRDTGGEMLLKAVSAIKGTVTATRETLAVKAQQCWAQLAEERCLLQATTLQEVLEVLGPVGDLPSAVLAGSLERVEALLQTEAEHCSSGQLNEALELAVLLRHEDMLSPLLQRGADPWARDAAAWAWARAWDCVGQPAGLLRLQQCPTRPRSSCSTGVVGNMAVAVWCLGMQRKLLELRATNTPPPRLESLQQFLQDKADLGQKAVASLLSELQQQWPELFASRQLLEQGSQGSGKSEQPLIVGVSQQELVAALWPVQAQLPHLQPWSACFSSCSFIATTPAEPSAKQVQRQSSYLQQQTAGLAASCPTVLPGIRTLLELPPASRCSPLQLVQCLQAWTANAEPGTAGDLQHSRLVTASDGGGVAVWCHSLRRGVVVPGVSAAVLQPSSYILPSLISSNSAYEPMTLQLVGGLSEQSSQCSQLLLKQGEQLHVLELLDGATSAASSTAVQLPPQALASEGLLLLAIDADFFIGTAQPLLVLDVTTDVAAEFNDMATGRPGVAVVHWLYHLLFQPASQLQDMFGTGLADASSSSSSSRSSAGHSSHAAVQQALQDICKLPLAELGLHVTRPGDSDAAPVEACAAAASANSHAWLQLRLSASRAAAAYNLLAAAIVQQKLCAVEWLLQRIMAESDGSWIEACLAAQQRLAWTGMTGSLQVPLLVLAAVTGSKEHALLEHWSKKHDLPLLKAEWGGVTGTQLWQAAQQSMTHQQQVHKPEQPQPQQQQQLQQQEAVRKLVAGSTALLWLQDAVDTVMQGIRQQAVATQEEWSALPDLLPGLQMMETLQELESRVGTKGDVMLNSLLDKPPAPGSSQTGGSQQPGVNAAPQGHSNDGSSTGSQPLRGGMTGKDVVSSSTTSTTGVATSVVVGAAADSSGGGGGSSGDGSGSGGSGDDGSGSGNGGSSCCGIGNSAFAGGPDKKWDCLFKGQDNLTWEDFWRNLQAEVTDPHAALTLEQQYYVYHELYLRDKQEWFKELFSPKDKIFRNELQSFASLTTEGYLAEVIDLAMRSRWSGWVGDSSAVVCSPSRGCARAGDYITSWRLYTGYAGTCWLDTLRSPSLGGLLGLSRREVLVSIKGMVGKHLLKGGPEGSIPDRPPYEIHPEVQQQHFHRLQGWRAERPPELISFQGQPSEGRTWLGKSWCLEGGTLPLGPTARVAGLQLQTSTAGRVEAARFLFRSPERPEFPDNVVDLVFISHTGADETAAQFAHALHQALRDKKVVTFYDARVLAGGDRWRQRICDAAMRCKVFIAVVSPHYLERQLEGGKTEWRPWVLLELHLALKHSRVSNRVLPVLYKVSLAELKAAAAKLECLGQQVVADISMTSNQQRMSWQLTAAAAAADIRQLVEEFSQDCQAMDIRSYPVKGDAVDAVVQRCTRLCRQLC